MGRIQIMESMKGSKAKNSEEKKAAFGRAPKPVASSSTTTSNAESSAMELDSEPVVDTRMSRTRAPLPGRSKKGYAHKTAQSLQHATEAREKKKQQNMKNEARKKRNSQTRRRSLKIRLIPFRNLVRNRVSILGIQKRFTQDALACIQQGVEANTRNVLVRTECVGRFNNRKTALISHMRFSQAVERVATFI